MSKARQMSFRSGPGPEGLGLALIHFARTSMTRGLKLIELDFQKRGKEGG